MNQKKIEELAFRVVGDMGGAFTMALGYVGDRLGIFKSMEGAGPLTSEELAKKTKLNERYVREWLRAMVAADYIDYDSTTGKYVMTDEQAFVLSNEDSPMFVGGGFHFTIPSIYNVPKIMDAFRNGGGISYSEIGGDIPEAIERFFRPGYIHFLVKDWLGSSARLERAPGKGRKCCRHWLRARSVHGNDGGRRRHFQIPPSLVLIITDRVSNTRGNLLQKQSAQCRVPPGRSPTRSPRIANSTWCAALIASTTWSILAPR